MRATTKDIGGNFQNPTPGWHTMVVGSNVMWREKDGVATDTLLIPVNVLEGEEKGNGFMQSFGLDVDGGRKSLALFLFYLGVTEKIEKKLQLADSKELDEQGWGNMFLNPASDDGPNVLRNIITNLPENTCDIKVRIKKAKNRNGEMTEYANVSRYDFTGLGKKNDESDKGNSGRQPAAPTGPTGEAATTQGPSSEPPQAEKW